MAIGETRDSCGGGRSLHVDHFGLSIGPLSVGLPPAGTVDDVYRRYLDLVRMLPYAPAGVFVAPPDDLVALAQATGADPGFVAHRLAALQRA